MFRLRIINRVLPIGACASTILLCAAPATAGKRAVCTPALAAYKEAVEREKAGDLQGARDLLQSCMQATVCGGLVPKCAAKYNALANGSSTSNAAPRAPVPSPSAARAPILVSPNMCSVVPVVTDDAGEPRVDVQVKVDGTLLTSHLDGKGLPVEPGVHEFTFATDRGVFATQKVMVVEGQHNREIAVSMGGPKPAAPTASNASAPVDTKTHAATRPSSDSHADDKTADEKPSPDDSTPQAVTPREEPSGGGSWAMPKSIVPYVLGGVGLAGVAAGGLLTFWGNQDNSSLRNSCGVNSQCDPSSVDHIRKLYLVSDISYGVGAAALAVTTFLFATSRSTETAVKPAARDAVVFGVQPVRSGGFASVSGKF